MPTNNRRFLLPTVGAGLVLLLIAVLLYVLSLRTLTIHFSNTAAVEVYKTSSVDGNGNPKPVKRVTESGQSIKLRKGSYTLHYAGNKGYESRYIEIVLQDDREYTVKPDFSEEKKKEIAAAELSAVGAVLSAKYPKMSLYTVAFGKVLDEGGWYIAKLNYTGTDQFNSDSLRAVFKKTGGSWELMTTPPSIVLNKYHHSDIPVHILTEANNIP